MLSRLSRVWPFVTLWTRAHQPPLSVGNLHQIFIKCFSSFVGIYYGFILEKVLHLKSEILGRSSQSTSYSVWGQIIAFL